MFGSCVFIDQDFDKMVDSEYCSELYDLIYNENHSLINVMFLIMIIVYISEFPESVVMLMEFL